MTCSYIGNSCIQKNFSLSRPFQASNYNLINQGNTQLTNILSLAQHSMYKTAMHHDKKTRPFLPSRHLMHTILS